MIRWGWNGRLKKLRTFPFRTCPKQSWKSTSILKKNGQLRPEELLPFLVNKVLMIYVATEDLEDAFSLFMILNARGISLRNSDILKSMNLGALELETDKIKYAKLWEEAEGELGGDFDRFLNHI